MKIRTIIAATSAALAFSMAGPIYAHDTEAQTVTKNFEAAIPNIPGKSLIAVEVNYARGATSAPHTHAKSAFIYAYAKKYGLDPIDSKAPRILTPAELKYFCEPSPPPPRTIPRRAKFPDIETPLPAYVRRDARLRRPSYHRTSRCSGAPVFGVDGRLIAVLDVSAIDPELSERAHALTGALTVRSARDRRAIFS